MLNQKRDFGEIAKPKMVEDPGPSRPEWEGLFGRLREIQREGTHNDLSPRELSAKRGRQPHASPRDAQKELFARAFDVWPTPAPP